MIPTSSRPRPAHAGAALLVSCVLVGALGTAATAREKHEEPPLPRVTTIVEASTGTELSWDALVERLAAADAVFVGETHLDETTHRAELELFARLLDAREGRVVLAMEMFARDAQPVLDRYLRGEIDEATFLAEANPWSNYRTAYRPLVELARRRGAPVVASNAPRGLRMKLAFGGEEAWRDLTDEERALAPDELLPATDEYWARVDNATRGHRGMSSGGDRLYSTQNLWDNTMGDSVARALAAHPGHLVLHVNGSFHSTWRDGTVRQFLLRAPDATAATVAIRPVLDPDAIDPTRLAPSSDFLVFAAARTSDVNEGRHAVTIGREVKHALHLPDAASTDSPVPLLIWLVDDGVPVEDALALWRERLGDDAAALAVIEPLHRERQDDLSLAGRWFWPDSFRDDVGSAVAGVVRTWASLRRRMPVDPERIVIAGEGTGATVAAQAGTSNGWVGEALAFEPTRFRELRDLPLPMPRERVGPQTVRLTVVPRPDDVEWWTEEVADHAEHGLASRLGDGPADAWAREAALETAVREALGLPLREVPSDARRAHVALPVATPLARTWGRRLAARHARETGSAVLTPAEVLAAGDALRDSTPLPDEIAPALFADGERLPRAPGPFGGTTVLVLGDVTPEEAAAWTALEEDGVLSKLSRFHRVRIATREGERALPAVLDELAKQNRRNVLVVPAVYAAEPDVMRALQESVERQANEMTISWRSGLGDAVTR